LFPLELYVVDAAGVSCYRPQRHDLVRTLPVDVRQQLREAALDQDALRAPCIFVIAAALQRTVREYGPRAERYVTLEAGHAAQNLLLQAVALGLGAVPIGAFDDEQVQRAIELPPDERPLLLVAIGYAARG
jgi:SagB-type dehydrogenase family enzyme